MVGTQLKNSCGVARCTVSEAATAKDQPSDGLVPRCLTLRRRESFVMEKAAWVIPSLKMTLRTHSPSRQSGALAHGIQGHHRLCRSKETHTSPAWAKTGTAIGCSSAFISYGHATFALCVPGTTANAVATQRHSVSGTPSAEQGEISASYS